MMNSSHRKATCNWQLTMKADDEDRKVCSVAERGSIQMILIIVIIITTSCIMKTGYAVIS